MFCPPSFVLFVHRFVRFRPLVKYSVVGFFFSIRFVAHQAVTQVWKQVFVFLHQLVHSAESHFRVQLSVLVMLLSVVSLILLTESPVALV